MDQNGTTFLFFRCIFGLWFVLQGLAQTDYVGPRLFPTLNEHFSDHYEDDYIHSVPWKKLGIKVSADLFRELIGYVILVAGLLLLLNWQVKIVAFIMTLISIWFVYAHTLAGDPLYYAVCGGIIALVMLAMVCPLASKNKHKND